ncbi:ABC transporter substrate-binding protein [Pelotomaculum terephthalicicum JT]|uniref:ABC transporter substrate-binding protein n=1 Tax=Pelotomaculum terephthalicicum TaxID=206393 RepID=UPI001F0451CF|nr:ABC transporter substrate-binding protein [Pelotomaculum terephthalicicum]MCG9969761.1 ABC transporter substrate-binding protein [Pelotomaculum terephthalicicum JT]
MAKKILKNTLLVVLILSISALMAACSSKIESGSQNNQDNSWQRVKESNKLIVGLCAAYPPFESRNEKNGEIEGFDIDLADALTKELGIGVEIKDAEWPALLGGLTKGDYDVLITCMSKKEAAAENVNMSDVYYNLNDIIVVREDDKNINSTDDLKGKVIGVQLGSGSEQIADKMQGLKEIKRYNYNPEAFIDLKNKRIDAVIVGYAYAVNQFKEQKGFRILEEPLESAEIVMVLRKGEDNLTQKLNEALSIVKEKGVYSQLIDKWLKI